MHHAGCCSAETLCFREAVRSCAQVKGRLLGHVSNSERLWTSMFGTGRSCVGAERRLWVLVSLSSGDLSVETGGCLDLCHYHEGWEWGCCQGP